jgi:poly(3-hydroxybutyrate) depolymerase
MNELATREKQVPSSQNAAGGHGMLYETYQAHVDLLTPLRAVAEMTTRVLRDPRYRFPDTVGVRSVAALSELIARAGLNHERPPFEIERVRIGGREIGVREQITDVTPFASLLHFAKDVTVAQPRVLVVAPLAGHFPTLLRATVRTLLAEHDVYLTDWHNARDIGIEHGRFGLDEYIDHVIRFLDELGPGTHVLAVCQPCVPVLAATALMAQAESPAQPRSLTLMAGPVDARINPSKVNDLATSVPLSWFERNVIATVPWRYPGARRRVYPGFLQLTAFVSMNLARHAGSHYQLFLDLVDGDVEAARSIEAFYDEYFAVLDLPAEFYLETVQRVFQEYDLARGVFHHRGQLVEPHAIRRTSLLTVEGERDDICSVGQTLAAHDLCTGIRPARKRHHLQAGAGHYGVFAGRRWEAQIYPILRNVIQAAD